jgi:hypothetical protein
MPAKVVTHDDISSACDIPFPTTSPTATASPPPERHNSIPPKLKRRLTHGSERRHQRFRPSRVVKADQRDIFGHTAAGVIQRDQRPPRALVVGSEDRIERDAGGKPAGHRKLAIAKPEVAGRHQRRVVGQARICQRRAIARVAIVRLGIAIQPTQKSDPPPAMPDQVRHRRARSFLIMWSMCSGC